MTAGGDLRPRSTLLLVVLMFATLDAARADENLWKVLLVSRDSLPECTLDSVSEQALFVTAHNIRKAVPLDSIARLRFERRAHTRREATTGLLVGMVLGGYLGFQSDENGEDRWFHWGAKEYTIIGAASGMFYGYGIGAIVGVIEAMDSKYDLRELDRAGKRALIRQILGERWPKPNDED